MDIDKFKKFLSDPDPNTRKKAIIALAKSDYRHKLEILVQISKTDPSPAIREGVLKIIDQIKKEAPAQPDQKPAATPAPGTAHDRLQADAATQIGTIFTSGSIEDKIDVLGKLIEREVGFEDFQPKTIWEFLAKETDHKVVMKGMEYIFKEGTQDLKLVILNQIYEGTFKIPKDILRERVMYEVDSNVLSEAVKVLGKVGNDSDIDMITQKLKHVDDRVRISSILALRLIGNEFTHEYVLPMLHNKDETDEVKAKAAAYVFEKDPETAVFLMEEMLEKAKDKYGVQTVIMALEEINHKSVAKLLAKAQEKFKTYAGKNLLEEAQLALNKKK
ncbi:MAG: HEAT repeat domain-containing protein [Candidatus Wallbacteria bacterium]|nr:HEAT repeat domain-containing protein [Candidatus Wallbacteria bacterium]